MKKIRVGIVGYGNVGKGVEAACMKATDIELVAIFTRRDPSTIIPASRVAVNNYYDMFNDYYINYIDVMILCGGSATDLPAQGPQIAAWYNTVDSFDTHADIPKYFAKMNEIAKTGKKTAIISTGWDPGLFSLNRVYASAILPDGYTQTFWGYGVSQGHSDAVRRIKGVKDARQYTIPVESAVQRVRNGENPILTTREKHTRVCYVVAEEGADRERIENEITSMPKYFADYDTTVYFISEEEMERNHSTMPHAGMVFHVGETGDEHNKQVIEYSLKLDSNPEFTGSVLVAYARAAYCMNQEEKFGALTVLDVPPAKLSPLTSDVLLTMI